MRVLKRLVADIQMRAMGIRPIIRAVRTDALTYLRPDALNDLYDQVARLEREKIEGILIEAGCALGGSAIVIAAAKDKQRSLYVYDVFGMIPAPTDKDGDDVHERYEKIRSGESRGIGGKEYYGYQQDLIGTVKESFARHGFPVGDHNIHLVSGLFQDTMDINQKVAFAHIDGDWYESVMTCLERIEPHLQPGGVLVIDDYFHWSGCRTAVDEYFSDKKDQFEFVNKTRLHIHRRDA